MELGAPRMYLYYWLWGEQAFDEKYREPLTAVLDSLTNNPQFAPRDEPIRHWYEDAQAKVPGTLSDASYHGERRPLNQ